MAKNLSTRLERLENELQILLQLQSSELVSGMCCPQLDAAACDTVFPSESISEVTQPMQTLYKPTKAVRTTTKVVHMEDNFSNEPSTCICPDVPVSVNNIPTKIICPYAGKIRENINQGIICAEKILATPDPNADLIATKPLEDCVCSSEKNEVFKQLHSEQERRWRAEHIIDKLRSAMDANKMAVQEMIQSKKLALEMAKQLRDKYSTVRKSRQETVQELDTLRVQNAALMENLTAANVEKAKVMEDMRAILSKQNAEFNEMLIKAHQEKMCLEQKILALERKILDTDSQLLIKEKELQAHMNRRISADDPEVKAVVQQEVASIVSELQTKKEEQQRLVCKCAELQEKLECVQNIDDEKYHEAENEFKRMKLAMKEKEALISKEREELQQLVLELTDVVKEHKARIVELTNINNQQEILLNSQVQCLCSKDEEIALLVRDLEMSNQKSDTLENQVRTFQESMNCFHQYQCEAAHASKLDDRRRALEAELDQCRRSLETEHDKILIKDKIIEDQCETIKQLKNSMQSKVDEIRHLTKERDVVEKELELERAQTDDLMHEIEKAHWETNQLKQQIAEFEEEMPNMRNTDEMNKQKQLLNLLEKQVNTKQREWELQMKMLGTEKDQAINAAKFATKKLLETVADFQKQIATQKKVQRMLTSLLSQKETQLQAAAQKVSSSRLQCYRLSSGPLWNSNSQIQCNKIVRSPPYLPRVSRLCR